MQWYYIDDFFFWVILTGFVQQVFTCWRLHHLKISPAGCCPSSNRHTPVQHLSTLEVTVEVEGRGHPVVVSRRVCCQTRGKVSRGCAASRPQADTKAQKTPVKLGESSPGSHCVELAGRLPNDELLQRQMNKSPQHQNKHRDQGGCQSLPQQVQAHFGLPLRVTAVAVVLAPVPGTVVILRDITRRPEGFYPPDSGVALHFRASGASAASVALRRRFFSGRPTDRAEGQTSWRRRAAEALGKWKAEEEEEEEIFNPFHYFVKKN